MGDILHLPAIIPRGEFDILNDAIAAIRRIEFAENSPGQSLIGRISLNTRRAIIGNHSINHDLDDPGLRASPGQQKNCRST